MKAGSAVILNALQGRIHDFKSQELHKMSVDRNYSKALQIMASFIEEAREHYGKEYKSCKPK